MATKSNAIVMGGKGQVGATVFNILKNHGFAAYTLDLDVKPTKPPLNPFLHVCIPYSPNFLKSVREAIRVYKPRLVIIHSTVPVGTTRELGPKVVHSPVRGQHDKLEWSLLRFIKYVGGVTKRATDDAVGHMKSAGFPVVPWSNPESTELMKLLCLSRYLNDLAYYEVAESLANGPKSALAFSTTGRTLITMDTRDPVSRPSLCFPKGKAGGHCVMPVSKMLYAQTQDTWLQKNIRVFEPAQT